MRKIPTLVILSLILPCLTQAAEEAPTDKAVQKAAESFLATLDDSQKKEATYSFDSEERENWHFFPMERGGLPLKEMNKDQKQEAMNVLKSALSEKGYLKATQIIALEGVLAELEKNPDRRDMDKYYLAVFGDPGKEDGWGIRFEGHHLSINLTFVGDKGFSVTPSFMGTNPAEVRIGDKKGMRPLAAEEDIARSLAVSLLKTNPKVKFSDKAPSDILTGQQREFEQLEPVGVLASDMSEAQQEILFKLISEYVQNYRSDLADADMKKIKEAGMDKIHFGWAGSMKKGVAYYYRVQGPTFLMEAANTQNDANHMHAVWRDAEHDFGRDILGDHHHD